MKINSLYMKLNRNIIIIPTAAIVLSSGLLGACFTTKNSVEKVSPELIPTDSVKEFVPLHPPVVIPHSWKEAK